ncbi:hypothetical protein CYFUS_009133 [Cystobacter fuscus]|uniref:Uncharacterized protein n=1 Tax=Cystobacter fuscus TaxID=43 RepID=A0A250JJ42_9BACT|nr:hypothetical protein [Cystobacter fuscus]ATB43653.1 hypothetical protein CYFUS_009133 [Cystobacter fuscus]
MPSPHDDSHPDVLRRRLLELKETHPLHTLIKPMLLRGYATVGFVYDHHRAQDIEAPSVDAEYAWLDAQGNLRTDSIHEDYDAKHGCAQLS